MEAEVLSADVIETEPLPEITAPPYELAVDPRYFKDYPILEELFMRHQADKLHPKVQQQFVDRYIRTLEKKYVATKPGQTFCTVYFHDYFNALGYKDLLKAIKRSRGKTMVEKAINYENEHGTIVLLKSAHEAQQLANQGREVGVIGEYYYDKAEKIYTIHYSVVQPSLSAYTEDGEVLPYLRTGLISKRKDINGYKGRGAFLAQVGVANGLIDFRWAYNRKMNGIIQYDGKGNIRGGIIFVVFPEIDTEGGFVTDAFLSSDADLPGREPEIVETEIEAEVEVIAEAGEAGTGEIVDPEKTPTAVETEAGDAIATGGELESGDSNTEALPDAGL